MRKLPGSIKFDVGLVGQSISNTNVTGRYFSMVDAEQATAVLIGGALATGKVTTLALLQATDEAGTGAKGIPSTASPTATCTVTSPAKATEVTLALSTVLAADAVTINGLVFTAHATVTTKASRQFKIDGTDSADGDELAACINDATYGVPNVTAVNASGTITLRSKDGVTPITIASPASTITAAVTKYIAYVSLNAGDLDTANGFKYIAPKVTTDGVSICSVTLLRAGMRHSPTQAVGASASI